MQTRTRRSKTLPPHSQASCSRYGVHDCRHRDRDVNYRLRQPPTPPSAATAVTAGRSRRHAVNCHPGDRCRHLRWPLPPYPPAAAPVAPSTSASIYRHCQRRQTHTAVTAVAAAPLTAASGDCFRRHRQPLSLPRRRLPLLSTAATATIGRTCRHRRPPLCRLLPPPETAAVAYVGHSHCQRRPLPPPCRQLPLLAAPAVTAGCCCLRAFDCRPRRPLLLSPSTAPAVTSGRCRRCVVNCGLRQLLLPPPLPPPTSAPAVTVSRRHRQKHCGTALTHGRSTVAEH